MGSLPKLSRIQGVVDHRDLWVRTGPVEATGMLLDRGNDTHLKSFDEMIISNNPRHSGTLCPLLEGEEDLTTLSLLQYLIGLLATHPSLYKTLSCCRTMRVRPCYENHQLQ